MLGRLGVRRIDLPGVQDERPQEEEEDEEENEEFRDSGCGFPIKYGCCNVDTELMVSNSTEAEEAAFATAKVEELESVVVGMVVVVVVVVVGVEVAAAAVG